MEMAAMGRVVVTAKLENLSDLFEVWQGKRLPDQVRQLEVVDALVDTGATYLGVPKRYIEQLGLRQFQTRKARTTAGPRECTMYGTVQLTVQGREARLDVAEVPDDCPVLIGQVPLEVLDFVVDPVGQRLIGNPEHGGEQMIDMF
jgi:predicted aspartyl protease